MSRRGLRKAIEAADVVVEVLDARDPPSFRLKKVEDRVLELGKGLVLAINKIDLVPQRVYVGRTKRFERQGFLTAYVSATRRLGTRILRTLIKKAADKRLIRVAVVGYPNVGKSTIINVLRGHHGAATGAIPGITRRSQEYRLDSRIKVLDTPGVYPVESLEDMVYKGSVRPEELEDPITAAVLLIRKLRELDPKVIEKHYGVDDEEEEKALEKIALRRGLLLRGGEPNVEEAARIVIRDRQKAKIVARRDPPI